VVASSSCATRQGARPHSSSSTVGSWIPALGRLPPVAVRTERWRGRLIRMSPMWGRGYAQRRWGWGRGPLVSGYGWSGLSLDLDSAIRCSETTARDAAALMCSRFSTRSTSGTTRKGTIDVPSHSVEMDLVEERKQEMGMEMVLYGGAVDGGDGGDTWGERPRWATPLSIQRRRRRREIEMDLFARPVFLGPPCLSIRMT
jgi:hypothetical protein